MKSSLALRELPGPTPVALSKDPERSCRAHRRVAVVDLSTGGGQAKQLKEAGDRRPSASFESSLLPRLGSLLWDSLLTRLGQGVVVDVGPRHTAWSPWRDDRDAQQGRPSR